MPGTGRGTMRPPTEAFCPGGLWLLLGSIVARAVRRLKNKQTDKRK